jgi:uncharacterized protein (DUF305 family)
MPRDRAAGAAWRTIAATVLCSVALASCRTPDTPAGAPTVRPGAPGQPTRPIAPPAGAAAPYSSDDVAFMQGMISHHAQALEMTALLRQRSNRDDMRLLAERIDVSQSDEIKMMQRWLEARGQEVPGPHAMHEHALMPGMLTTEEMDQLAAASGAAFDRLFLESMIKHHEGALATVKDLFSRNGAAQGSDIFGFASDVDADQRMEIERMQGMLAAGR